MTEFNRNKFWVALGRFPGFTEDDNYLLRVFPKTDCIKKNCGWELEPKYIEADNLEAARRQAHLFIDKMFNGYMWSDKERGIVSPPAPSPSLEGLESLTIEGGGGDAKPVNGDLLNLTDLK